MKLLKDRQAMAMACNFGRYPVLKIDLADSDEYGLKGCRIRIDAGEFRDGSPYIIGATIRAYYDEHVLTTSSDVCCLTNDFTYRDYIDTVERAQAPLIGPDQDVVIAIYDSRTRLAFAPAIVHTAPRVSRQCSTPLSFVDADMTPYLRAAGFKVGEENENG
ncbi:MAG: hypothetical protein ACLTL5_02570 [Oscillospiraceae bacterium]|jgi:hypothetical protein